jgi:hypothetical protein
VERLDLVEDLLANREDFDGTLAADWAAEAEDGLAAFHSGDLGAVPMGDAGGSPRRR